MDVQDIDDGKLGEAITRALQDAGFDYVDLELGVLEVNGAGSIAAVVQHLKRILLADPVTPAPDEAQS